MKSVFIIAVFAAIINISVSQEVPIELAVDSIDADVAATNALINTVENDGSLDGKDHECYRDCVLGEKPKRCYYKFHLEWYEAMSKACKDCPHKEADCMSKDCIPANGVNRTITVLNRKLPGPKIEVCQYDTIVVDLVNELLSSTTTIHWHGMHQIQTPYMDGAPFVTQCPIQPETTFRYTFQAAESGTHFYHSHIGMQRGDGTYGPLIIRRPKILEHSRDLYDQDIADHVMMVTDWTDSPALGLYMRQFHIQGTIRPSTLLINGAGKFQAGNAQHNDTAPLLPSKFTVKRGQRYRFRLINAEFLSCPVELSVEGHNLTVIASDGAEIVPITVSALVSFAGERFDFVLNANQVNDNYRIKFRSLLACADITEARQIAILHYEDAADDAEPDTELSWTRPDGLVLNHEDSGEVTTDPNEIAISSMRSYQESDDTLKAEPDAKIFIEFDLYGKNHSTFHRLPYMRNQVDALYRSNSPQFNHISMKLPKSALLVNRPSPKEFCNINTIGSNCDEDFCTCIHAMELKLNAVVELILIDTGKDFTFNHPHHLHGHYFRVLSQVKLGDSTTAEEVKALDSQGLLRRNFVNPPLKDVVSVPDGGYVVLRFKASNPGYWLFHCHIEYHADVGMSMVFKVGEHKDMKPVPKYFPTCGDYGV